jgi:hypothetical protein
LTDDINLQIETRTPTKDWIDNEGSCHTGGNCKEGLGPAFRKMKHKIGDFGIGHGILVFRGRFLAKQQIAIGYLVDDPDAWRSGLLNCSWIRFSRCDEESIVVSLSTILKTEPTLPVEGRVLPIQIASLALL